MIFFYKGIEKLQQEQNPIFQKFLKKSGNRRNDDDDN